MAKPFKLFLHAFNFPTNNPKTGCKWTKPSLPNLPDLLDLPDLPDLPDLLNLLDLNCQ